MMRYVRKDRRIYDHSLCKLCGTAGFTQAPQCEATTCMACGTRQCHSNGGGRGLCSICLVGILPGWSGWERQCRYKGCRQQAVACDGKWSVCMKHLEHRRPGYIAAQLAARDKQWVCIEDGVEAGHDQWVVPCARVA